MSNHIHLQLETINFPPGKIMQYVLSNYANYYNSKYKYRGHLWEGRYKAEIINDDTYMLQASRYIHLNPVRANIVEDPLEYKWSSYPTFMEKVVFDLVSEYKILDYFQGDKESQIMKYKDYVDSELLIIKAKQNKKTMREDLTKLQEGVVKDGNSSQ